jgi:hypothetical protein
LREWAEQRSDRNSALKISFHIPKIMPYVSPRGTVKSTIPPKHKAPPEEPAKIEKPVAHNPSVELGEVNSRDRDPSIVQELEHWKGWGAKHEIAKDEKEDMDPLDENEENEVIQKTATVERPQKERPMPLRIVTEPKRRVLRVSEIEVDERFISDDLL